MIDPCFLYCVSLTYYGEKHYFERVSRIEIIRVGTMLKYLVFYKLNKRYFKDVFDANGIDDLCITLRDVMGGDTE